MDMDKKSVKIFWLCVVAVLVVWVGISIYIQSTPPKLKGTWIINDDEEMITFYDNDICVCDGEEMIYNVLDSNTISFDGEVFEFEITDKKNKKMMLDEKY